MLPSRERRLQKLNNPRGRWDALGGVPKIKLGDNTQTFIAADTNKFIQAKTEAIGYNYTPMGSSISPGPNLRHSINHQLVSYAGVAFNPVADRQPSTAVFPVQTFVQQFIDPDTKALANLFGALQQLAGVVGL